MIEGKESARIKEKRSCRMISFKQVTPRFHQKVLLRKRYLRKRFCFLRRNVAQLEFYLQDLSISCLFSV